MGAGKPECLSAGKSSTAKIPGGERPSMKILTRKHAGPEKRRRFFTEVTKIALETEVALD
jgi:hypothetical protein